MGIAEDIEAWGDLYEWKLQTEKELQAEADSYLYLFDGMPRVNAYLYMTHVSPALGFSVDEEIHVSEKYYIRNYPNLDWEIQYVIKHEMTHCWIRWMGITEDDHGPAFNKKLNEVLNA